MTNIREKWAIAQVKERQLDEPETFEKGLEHFRTGYEHYFRFLEINPDLEGKKIIEIGPANFPALHFCHNEGKSFIIEPMISDHLKKCVQGKDIDIIQMPAEDIEFPSVDEVWLLNVLQHTIDPDIIIQKAMEKASVIRFFEPINCGTDECHLHDFTLEYFRSRFGSVKHYAENQEIKGFHTHECAYGIWRKND